MIAPLFSLRRTSVGRRVRCHAGWSALAIYFIVALILFGKPLWHEGECLCGQTPDAGTFAWAFEWWPHALTHGLNPFTPKLLYAPEGINLAHGQLIPVAALLFAPITAVAGPLFALNLAVFLSPVLAAFFAFLLCRRVTGAYAPALVGGWLFGFSTYVLAQMTSHLNLALVFPIPAIVHLVLRRVDGDIARSWFVALTTLALTALFGFSPEIFVSFAALGTLALIVATVAWAPTLRQRIRTTATELIAALGLTALLVSPYLYYAAKPGMLPILPWRTEKFSNDLLGFVLPTPTTAVGGEALTSTTYSFTAGLVEGSVYLGPPLLILIVVALVTGRRRPAVRVLGVVLVVAAVMSLGSRLHVDGQRLIPLPWAAFNEIPVSGHFNPCEVFALCLPLRRGSRSNMARREAAAAARLGARDGRRGSAMACDGIGSVAQSAAHPGAVHRLGLPARNHCAGHGADSTDRHCRQRHAVAGRIAFALSNGWRLRRPARSPRPV